MSYDKNINNYTIKFKDEESHLNCRLNYIEYCKNVPIVGFEIGFLQFIQDEMYDKDKCEVEDISPAINSGPAINAGDFTYSVNMGFDSGETNNIDFGEWVTNGTWTTNGTYTYNVDNANNIFNMISPVPNEQAPKKKKKRKKKKKPPDDPIDNRFEILDL